jgi:hypothetical protein
MARPDQRAHDNRQRLTVLNVSNTVFQTAVDTRDDLLTVLVEARYTRVP